MHKALFILLLSCCVFNSSSQSRIAGKAMFGELSPNSENEPGDADPPYREIVSKAAVEMSRKKHGAQGTNVSQLEKGFEIVKEVVDLMCAYNFNFFLLKSHKYRVADCLALKVSSGEFQVKFKSPEVKLSNTGKFSIKLSLDKIKFSAFKLKTKPCSKPEHLLNPCHFGGKFEVGGEAKDVSVTFHLQLVAYMGGAGGVCYWSIEDFGDIDWKIGSIDLKPLPALMDNAGRKMLEDALNGGLFWVIYEKFMAFTKQVIPKHYEACQTVYGADTYTTKLPGAVMDAISGGRDGGDNEGGEKTDPVKTRTEPIVGSGKSGVDNQEVLNRWEIRDGSFPGVLGRLVFDYPKDTEWDIMIYKNNEFLTSYSSSGSARLHNLAPGEYGIRMLLDTIHDVRIEKGRETRIRSGVLSVISEGDWSIYDAAGKKFYYSNNKPMKLALPVGSFILKLGGEDFPLNIKDGEMVEF